MPIFYSNSKFKWTNNLPENNIPSKQNSLQPSSEKLMQEKNNFFCWSLLLFCTTTVEMKNSPYQIP